MIMTKLYPVSILNHWEGIGIYFGSIFCWILAQIHRDFWKGIFPNNFALHMLTTVLLDITIAFGFLVMASHATNWIISKRRLK